MRTRAKSTYIHVTTTLQRGPSLVGKRRVWSTYSLTHPPHLPRYDKYFVPVDGGTAVEALLARLDPQEKDRIDYIEWSSTLGLADVGGLTQHCRATGPLKQAALSEEETRLMLAMKARLDVLARRAASLGVRLMVDAEQSFFQPAIDSLVLELMAKHNRERFVVYTTIQCYLKDAATRLQDDMDRAKRQGYYFAAKLVRGAYMVTERKRAAELGYESPVHETIAATHATYDGCMERMLEAMAQGDKVEVLIASHNQRSIEKSLASMARLGLEQEKVGVYFGQLLGMSDYLTMTLYVICLVHSPPLSMYSLPPTHPQTHPPTGASTTTRPSSTCPTGWWARSFLT